jgi:hypothetical protein
MGVCVLHQAGEVLVHRQRKAAPEPVLQAMAPAREDLGVCGEGLCTWSWRAALGTPEGLALVLGQALSRTARHGGKAKHDPRDAPTMAVRLRGGRRPQAAVDPAARRATPARLRRRMPRRRHGAALRAPSHQTTSQANLPEISKKRAAKAHRDGGGERLPQPAVPQSRAVDGALSDAYDRLLTAVERSLVPPAPAPEAQTG